MPFGLSTTAVKKIKNILGFFPNIEEVIIYGSRAKGNYKPASDINLTLKGQDITLTDLNKLALMLDDLLLPQKFDISIYNHISNPDLVSHINRVGKSLKISPELTTR